MFFRKLQKRKNSLEVRGICALAAFSLCLFFIQPIRAADKHPDLQMQFDRETHSYSKIKILDKLGEAQFRAATDAGRSSDYETVGFIFEKYRDNVRDALQLLKQQEPSAERHGGDGYRRIELQVRKGIREVEETLIVVPAVVRPPLQIVRQDLIDMDDYLIHQLFPKGTKDPAANPPAAEAKP
jgi:hypothetical protein